ncbi:protein CEPU-1-like isoform X1 [Vanessa tameamea]|uniref:Protein CEPU-1-like isoform X1 n=1 Tax=Vanessa tameamea TaxID=334116 RepID=A0A8B8I8L4_VANTA
MWLPALLYLLGQLDLSAGGSDTTDPDAIFAVNNGTAATDTMIQPHFDNSTKREYTAAVGQPAYLHCRVKNLGDRSVSWIRKRDLHILTVGVHTYSSDARFAALHTDGSDEWTLRVAHAQPRDSGAYECQVSTEPKISLSFWLTVVVSKAEILSGPELFVRAGSDINLTCVARHAPDPPSSVNSFIYWYRGANVVNYAQRGGISVETEQRTRTSRLLIARASPRDSGNYTCAPSSSDSASVVVHVLNGERPAAMQSDAYQTKPTNTLIFLIILILRIQKLDNIMDTFVLVYTSIVNFQIKHRFISDNSVRLISR